MYPQVIAVVLLIAAAGVNSQGAVSLSVNHDGTSSIASKIPIARSDSNMLSFTGSRNSLGALSKGLTLDNT
jgi:hypothetical protein